MVDQIDGSDSTQHSKIVIRNLNAENAQLREKIQRLEANLSWHEQHTRLDGSPNHPRPIANIIRERDEAYVQLAQFGKMLNLLLNDYKKPMFDIHHHIEMMRMMTIKDTHTLPHTKALASFLTMVYDLMIERQFYEAVAGEPLEWIPVRTEVIDGIEKRIQIFDGAYEFGQRVQDGSDKRLRTIVTAKGPGNTVSKQ